MSDDPMILPPREEAAENFERWNWMDDDLERYLTDYLPEVTLGRYGVGSLPLVERAFLAHFDDKECFFGTMRYLGETILRAAGGRWEWEALWEKGHDGGGLPFVRVDGPGGKLAGGTVNLYHACRIAGGNQSGTVFSELVTAIVGSFGPSGPLRRSSGILALVADKEDMYPALAEFLLPHDEELGAFLADPGLASVELDGSAESLDRLEDLMIHRYPDMDAVMAEWDTPFIRGASRYTGQLLLDSAPGRWLMIDPRAFRRPPTDFERCPSVQRVFPDGSLGHASSLITSFRRAVGSSEVNVERRRSGRAGILRRALQRFIDQEPMRG